MRDAINGFLGAFRLAIGLLHQPRKAWRDFMQMSEPACKRCGKGCAYYGPIGGYSVQCKDCNAKHAAWQRANRRKRK